MPGGMNASAARTTGRRWLLVGVAGYAALAGVFLVHQLLRADGDPQDVTVGDLLSFYYPGFRYGFTALRHGTLPLWNPYQSCGSPFLASPYIGFFYPLYLPFLFLDAATAIGLDITLHQTIAALGTALFCVHLGIGWGPAFLAGLVYAYQGSLMAVIYYPDFVAGIAWAPWMFLLVDRLLLRRGWGDALALGVLAGTMLLGANLQFVYFTSLALLPFVMGRAVVVVRAHGPRDIGRVLPKLVAAAVLGVLLALVRVVPNAEFMRQSWRPPGSLPIEAVAIMQRTPERLLFDLTTMGPAGARAVYAGILPLAFAVVGLATWSRRSVSIPLALIACGAACYALGTGSALYRLLFRLPMGGWFRGPNRALFLVGLAVAVLAAAGLDRLRPHAAPGDAKAARVVLPLALVLVLVSGLTWGRPGLGGRLAAVLAVGVLPLATTLGSRARRGHALSVAMVVGVVLADLWGHQVPAGVLPARLGGYFERYADFFAHIRARQGYDRTFVWGSFGRGDALRFHSDVARAGINHGIWMVTDYGHGGGRMTRYLEALGDWPPLPVHIGGYLPFRVSKRSFPLLELTGTRFALVPDAMYEESLGGLAKLGIRPTRLLARDGVSLYELPPPVPRAFVVGRVEVVRDPEALLQQLRTVDARRVAYVEEEIPGWSVRADEAPGTSRAVIVEYAPERVVVDTDSVCAGLLVLTDQYDAGWRAFVDGVAAPLYRTDFLFRGVPVPAGSHRVTFEYRSASLWVGAAGSGLGLLVVLAAGYGWWRRRPAAGGGTAVRGV